jgi:tetratricopeptide (TPR) repeat protein
MRGFLVALALLVPVPATAQDSDDAAPDFRAMSGEELGARLVALGRAGMGDPCKQMVPLFDELHRRNPRESRYENGLLAGQAYCAYEEKRYVEGMNLVEQVERRNPGNGGFEPLGLYMSTQLNDGREALSRLRAMASSGMIATLPNEVLGWTFRTIRQNGEGKRLDAFAYELAESSAFARMDPEAQALLAGAALSHAARSGETAQVDTLLGHVRSPSSIEDYLALRKYEAIWPQIERRAGDNLSPLSDDYVTWTAARAAEKPEDRDRLSEYSYALLFAGRYREAADLAQGWLGARQHEGEIEEGDAWALNIQAYAYDALGQPAEADRVFDRLAQVSPDEHPWVVNFVINRASRLLELGRWEESLAASEVARPVADEHGSDYARMLVASYRACALHKLGRLDEAARALDFVREHFADAPTDAGQALLCADRDDEAAKLLKGLLADESERDKLLDTMQDQRFTLFGSPTSQLRQTRDLILARPELRDEALKYVRLLPERFVPVAYLRRMELAQGRQ